MKYRIKMAVILLAGVLLNSCSNNEQGDDLVIPQVKHKVSVNASGFNISESPMKRSAMSNLTDHISKLHYFIMKSIPQDGGGFLIGVIKHEEQEFEKDPENFGRMTFDLEDGNYTIAVIGEQKNEIGGYCTIDFNGDRAFLSYPRNTPLGDLFMSKKRVVVNHADTTEDFTLERIVGQLEVKITDPIPAGTDRIDILLLNDIGNYYFEMDLMNGPLRNVTYSTKINSEDIGSTSFSRKIYVLRTGGPIIEMMLTAYDKEGMIIESRARGGIELRRNQKTTLTASGYFRQPISSGFLNIGVEINDVWEDIPVQEF